MSNIIEGKFYRVSYNGVGIYVALKEKIGWDWKTVKQDPDINWLPTPQVDEYKDTYRSFFTTLGYKTFQAKTMKVIDKYLDPKKIKVNEYHDIPGILMYKDQYQVVVDQGDEVMNEKFGVTTMDNLVAFRRDFNEYVEEKCFTPQPDDVVNEEAEYGNNWFISEDDIYLNWDKWEDGSAHLVFVNGLSGSGKSTLGRKISENYDAYYVELDIYGWGIVGPIAVEKNRTNYEYIKEKDRKLYEYMKAKRIPPDIFAKIDKWNFTKEEEEFKVREIEKYLHWLAFDQKERVVVEGGYTGVVMVRNPELWKDTPIVFKGTSVTKSIFRRMIRATKKNGPIEIVKVIKAIKPQYLDHMIPETNASRKAMLSGRDDWEYVKEATSTKMPNIEFKKSIDGTYNAITYINGHMYRPRAEILILNEEGDVLLRKSKEVNQYGTKYNLPGGGFDNPNEKPEDVAFRESCEEVKIIPKDVKYTGIVYISEYGDKVPEWHKKILWPVGIKYVGAISYVCIGTYYKRYSQYIKVKDRQDYIDEYNFYDYYDIKNMLRQEHIEALNMYHEEHNESNMLKEAFTQIEADKSPHTKKKKLDLRKIPTKIEDFRDFLKKIKNPEMVMKWFLKVNIRWTPHGGSNDHPFQWPDWLIKQRMGNCFDQSIFLHYFCRAKRIDHKMYLVTWLADNGQGTGHAVPLYKKGDKVYVFAYLRPKMGFIGGPFRSYEEAKRVLDNFFLMYINQFFKAPSTPYSSYLSDDDLANFDKYYNNRKITQTEYIVEGLGKNMRSSHLFKIKVKGFAFPNPILPTYDCIVAVFKTISTIYNFFTANEEVDIDYGDEVEIVEEDSDGIDRKYTRSYRNFDEFCRYIKTPQEVMNWYKINKVKWNKPTPTGEFYKKPITWPDEMVKEKEGDCFDHAIFVHYFCDRNNIDNYIVRFVRYRALRANSKWYFAHHFVCILKTDAGWVGFEYDSMPHNEPWGYDERNAMKSSLIGPYRTKEEAAKFFSDFYDYLFDQYEKNHRYRVDWEYRELIRCKTIFLNTKVINLIDKVYGDKSFTQEEFYNLVKSEMGDTNYEGQSYESGCFFSDILNSLIVGANKIRSFREESINEEDQLTEDDWIHDPSLMYRRSNKRKFDKIKNFDQFCNKIDTVYEALSYFILEKIRWTSDEEMSSPNRPFYWPDDIIRDKIGVCMDHSIFFHQFCDRKGIENKIGFMIWRDENNESGGSHGVPMFKQDGRMFCIVYLPNIGWIQGPYDSWEECVEETGKVLSRHSDLTFGGSRKWYAITEVVSDELVRDLDKISGRKDITFPQFMIEDGARRLRNSKLVKIQYKTFAIWNPVISVWNLIRFLRNNFGLDIPYYGLEESTLLEEKLSADERRCFGLPKKKKYPMPDEAHVRAAIRFFNHCDPEDEEELARNIKKYMKKYNMKDVNVSDNNRFKKYYHPEDAKEEKKPIEEAQMTSKRNIFLTSAGLENDEVRQTFISSYRKSIKESKVLYVTAAAIDKESIAYLDECWKDLLNVGINPNNIIEYNFDKHMDYDDFMKFDIAYICGGDENHLIQVINKSGMRDNFILAINNGLVYIGVSAGACIASPYVDNGLNLIPNKVDVHYSKKESTRNGSLPPKHVQINLSNDQAIWINGNNAKIIGRSKDEMNNEAYIYMKPYISGAIKSLSMIKPVEESGIQKSGTFQDTLFVYNRLSDKEKSLLGRHHVDSPACVYRKVEYSNNTPIGWIELYDSSKVAMMTKQEYDENIKDLNIGIAVDKEFRGKGIATKLIKSAVQFFKSSQYETLTYIVRDGNDRSKAFAKKCGFAYMWRRKKEHETIFMITNPTKMRNAINEAYLYIRASVNNAKRRLSMLESSAAMGGPVVGMEINDQTVHYSNPGMFIIQYSDGNDTGYGITNDLKTKYFLRHDKKKNKLVKEDYSEFLKDKYFGIYSIIQEHRDLWNNLLTSFYENPKCLIHEDSRTLSLYEYFSGRRELVGDQIDYDENFNRVEPLWLDLIYNMKLQDPSKLNIPVINENYNGGDFRKHITLPQGIREFVSSSLHSNELVLCEDPKGMYLLDENNNLVSRYITQEELEVISDGISS